MNTMAIVVACGKEEEIAPGTEAAFLPLGTRPIIAHTLRALEDSPAINSVVVVVAKERVDSALHVIRRYGCAKTRGVVVGGVNRMSSLRAVFGKMKTDPSVVVVVEASRPFVTQRVLAETVKRAQRYGCAIAGTRVPDATKSAPKGNRVRSTLERNSVWAAQTPQAFKTSVLKDILSKRDKNMKIVDDESEFVKEPAETHLVEAGPVNMKVRGKADLSIASALLNADLTERESGVRRTRPLATRG